MRAVTREYEVDARLVCIPGLSVGDRVRVASAVPPTHRRKIRRITGMEYIGGVWAVLGANRRICWNINAAAVRKVLS